MPTVLVSLHSFTPVYAGIARPGISARSITATPHLPPLLLQLLRAEGDLVVGDNEPYAVSDETDYTIPVHGEAARVDEYGDRDPPGFDRRSRRREGVGGAAGADFCEIERIAVTAAAAA
jgi:hypothetical protein